MAYDPKDANDKKIVDKLIADALKEAASDEDHEVHSEVILGLKKKNEQLLAKIKKLQETGVDAKEVANLEASLEKSKDELKAATKSLKEVTKERDTFKSSAETEGALSRQMLVDNNLTEALVSANVGKNYLPAVRKLLADRVEIKVDGDKRSALIDGKSLGEFVKTWSQGDEGKHYVVAPANGGGGAPGGQAGQGSGKTITRSAYEANPASYAGFFKEGGKIVPG